MDHYKVSAPAKDKDGNPGTLTIQFKERPSERVPREEMAQALMMASCLQQVTLTGTMAVDLVA